MDAADYTESGQQDPARLPEPSNDGDGSGSGPEVLIIGAGPVGLTLANYLGMYGIRTTILESRDTLIDYPRGVGMDDECLRVFQAVGLIDSVLPHTSPDQWMRFMTARGRCFMSIEPSTREFGWPRRNAFVQPLVDQALLEGLERFPHVDVRWGHTAVEFRQDGDRVTVVAETADGPVDVSAAYLVGADGGRSAVRKAMGVGFEGKSDPTRWLVVDIRNDPLGMPNVYVYCDPNRPHVSIGLPHAIRRFEFMLFDHEDAEAFEDRARVDELVRPMVPGADRIDYIAWRVYTHHARVASSFQSGAFLLAGDAAHLMPVWQGQGYNSGIRDAANLGWKLTCVLRGVSAPEIVGTYDLERRGHASAMVQISETAGALVRPTSKVVAALRDSATRVAGLIPPVRRYFLEMRYKPMPRYTEGVVVHDGPIREDSPVGRLFIQPHVATLEHSRILLDDAIGPWISVLAWGADPRVYLSEEALEVWRGLGARFVSVVPITQMPENEDLEVLVVGDVTGALKGWFDDRPESFIVLRPDRFVAAACRPTEATVMTTRFAESIHARPGGRDDNRPVLPVAHTFDGPSRSSGRGARRRPAGTE